MREPSPSSDQSAATPPAPLSPECPPPIPDHELLRRIGRGAYGEVWIARSVMGAFRAVKIVRRSSFDDNRPFEREFEGIRRFEPISRSHDSQLDILHVGRGEDCFYYIMELADDRVTGPQIHPDNYQPRTLKSDLASRQRLSFEDCLLVGVSLATALEHLHTNGLVHRDIKPSNVIFVNGIAKLADIGLVTGADNTRSYVGTEGFAAPEGPGTIRADIFSLGKVLYELSTGKDRQHFPELPTDLREHPEHQRLAELNVVIVRACQHHPEDRYGSAREIRADLEFLRNGRSLARRRRLKARVTVIVWVAIALLLLGVALRTAYWFGKPQENNTRNVAPIAATAENLPSPVQWLVSSGGNGHWYEPVPFARGLNWERADAAAQAKGGYLVDILSAAENEFVFSLIDRPEYWTNSKSEELSWSDGPWIGAFQEGASNEPAGDFVWSHNKSPLAYANWHPGQPDNRKNEENHVKFFTVGSHDRSSVWNDSPGWTRSAYIIEYDFDPTSAHSTEGQIRIK
jgi:serine/threonine protein kinase